MKHVASCGADMLNIMNLYATGTSQIRELQTASVLFPLHFDFHCPALVASNSTPERKSKNKQAGVDQKCWTNNLSLCSGCIG